MTDDPLDRYEDQIYAELSSYQSQLDQGEVPSGEALDETGLPDELQEDLEDFRDCLDQISARRTTMKTESAVVSKIRAPAGLPDDDTPFHIGRFEIAEQLGVGGFGIVFRGIDPVMNREVAIKIPRPEFLGSQELSDRFASEAAAVSQLEHPNIVPVYESDCLEVVPYIVMPYIAGKTLARWRSEQKDVAPRTAAEIVRQLATALSHAHERGVLHRDLKPGNVLLAERETPATVDQLEFIPKLTDFGLAKCADTDRPDTRTGSMLGTASYMSPEQIEGRTRDITSRSDVYGLGVVLYELLAGHPPFHDANQLRTIQKVLRDEPPSLQSIGVKVPVDLEVICLKCLEKEPSKRYSSAGALADDLHRFLHGEPIHARPIPLITRITKWSKRNPAYAVLIGAAVTFLLAIEGVSLWYNGLLNSLHNVAEGERRSRLEAATLAKRRAYVSDMRNAKVIADHNNVTQMLVLLDRYSLRPAEPDFRDFAWWYLSRDYTESSRVLGRHENGATAVAISPDGSLVASAGADSVIQLWTPPKRNPVGKLQGHGAGGVESVNFSPDGRRLVSAGEDGTVRVWDVESLSQVFSCSAHTGQVLEAIYSPDGQVIATCGADHIVRLWDAVSGAPLGELNGHVGPVNCLAFHPFESTLVSGGRDSRICFWDWKNRAPDSRVEGGAIQLPSATQVPRCIAFEPDGTKFDVGASNSMVIMFSWEEGQYARESRRRTYNGTPNCLAWPREGPMITALSNSEIHLADSIDPSLPGEFLRGHRGSVVSVAVSPDGASMASASVDGEVRYWPTFQEFSRINVAKQKGDDWDDEHRSYEVQWRNQYLAADFKQRELVLYKMPDRQRAWSVRKENEDGFVLSPSGNRLIIFRMDGLVTCYKTLVDEPAWTIQLPPRTQPFFINFAAIDNVDNLVAVAWGEELLVISIESHEILRRFAHPAKVWQIAFTLDEYQTTIPVSACNDGYIRLWNMAYARLERSLRVNVGPTYSVAVSDDCEFMATAGEDYAVRVWKYRTLEPVVVLPSSERPSPSRIGFLKGPTSSEILVRQNFQLSLWGIHDDAELLAFPDCGQFGSIAISPDGKQLAVPQHGWIRLIDGRKRVDMTNGPLLY